MSASTKNEQGNIDKKHIEGVLFAMMKELQTLASHPDKSHSEGPDFIQIDSYYAPDAEYDGMIGSMILENTLGSAFTIAAEGINWGDAIECASNYMQDRGTKTIRLGQKNTISSSFNRNGLSDAVREQMLQSYLQDLPKRKGIERWIAESQRKLYAIQKHAALGLAA
ncbi:MAG: hypothetical protein AAF244_04425 [Pseudomonadota bacterium]